MEGERGKPVTQVGVVIPVYYGRAYLEKALASVRQQTAEAFVEILVVEDGTPEEHRAQDIANRYDARYLCLPTNQGVWVARWTGAESLGPADYLAFLDQDDWWEPTFLERTLADLEDHPTAGFAVTNARIVSPDQPDRLLYQVPPTLKLRDLKMANQIVSPSQVLLRMAAWQEVKSRLAPDPAISGADDWLLWLALLSEGFTAVYRAEPLTVYRDHPGGAHHHLTHRDQPLIDTWFPRLGFSPWDQRQVRARQRLDALVSGWRQGRKSVHALLKAVQADPLAWTAAVIWRWKMKQYKRRA